MNPGEEFDTELAHDLRAEAAVLGSAMLSAEAAATVLDLIHGEEEFYRPAHQLIFAAIRALGDRGASVDPITVAQELGKTGDLSKTGGGPYLHTLISSVPTTANAGYYVKIIRRTAILRRLVAAGVTISQVARSTSDLDLVDDAIEQARDVLDEATGVTDTSEMAPLSALIDPFIDRLERGDQPGLPSPWLDLTGPTGGLKPGQLAVVGARPGIGKTVFLANWAHHVAVKLGQPVLFVSLEMSHDEMVARLVAHDGKINLRSLLDANLSEDDWRCAAEVRKRYAEIGTLFIDDDPHAGLPQIREKLRRLRRNGTPARLVVVDYLQLMETSGKAESRQVEVSKISRGLKFIAKEFDVPVLVGSQLNRDVEKRTDKRPVPADLRESGSVEQDSDIVILLHREDAYEPESPRAGEIDLILAKNRNGPQTTVTAAAQMHYARIDDMAHIPNIPPPDGARERAFTDA